MKIDDTPPILGFANRLAAVKIAMPPGETISPVVATRIGERLGKDGVAKFDEIDTLGWSKQDWVNNVTEYLEAGSDPILLRIETVKFAQ